MNRIPKLYSKVGIRDVALVIECTYTLCMFLVPEEVSSMKTE